MIKRLSTFFIIMLIALVSYSQDPLNLSFSTDQTPTPGQTYDVDVHVADFENILSVQLFVLWDSTVLEIDTVPFISSDLADFNEVAFALPSQTPGMTKGRVSISWFAFDLIPKDLPDDHLLFTMRFNTIGSECDTTSLSIGDIENIMVEIIDGNFNDIGATTQNLPVMIPGADCGGTGNEEGVGFIFGDLTTPPGSNICIPLTVQNFDTLETFQGSVMWDPTIVDFTGVQSFGLPGLTQGLFGLGNTAAGELTFLWFDNSGTSPQTLPDGSVIFEVCFDAIGSVGQSSVVKAFDGPTSIQASSPSPIGVREHYVDEGSITIAQDMGDLFTLTANNAIGGSAGSTVCVDVTTDNFDNISAIQLTMQWDSTIIMYDGVSNLNQDLQIFESFFNPAGAGKLRFSWNSANTGGEDLPDGTLVYSVCFTVLGDCLTSSAFAFIDDIVDIEIIDGNTNTIPFNMVDGSVSVICELDCSNVTITHPSCTGDSNGNIIVEIAGGTGPYQCVWKEAGSTIQTGEDDNGTCLLASKRAGIYTLCVTDAEGASCTQTITLEDPPTINVIPTVTAAPCPPDSGAISVVALGGTGNITVTWSPEISDFDNVPVGSYDWLAEDENGCTASGTVEIACSFSLDVQFTNGSECGEPSSIDTIIHAGGTGPYTNSIDPPIVSLDNVPNGTYTITATDDNGNTTSETITVEAEAAPAIVTSNISVTPAICNGAKGTVTYNITGGCEPLTCEVRVVANPPLAYQDCDGITEYDAGDYEVLVTDSGGNTATASFTIEVEVDEELSLSVSGITDAPCSDGFGSAILSSSGGCGSIDCSLTLNGIELGCDGSQLSPGTYELSYTDDLGSTVSQSITIGAPTAIGITLLNNMNGSVEVEVDGGSGTGYSFLWTFPNGTTTANTQNLSGLTAGGTYLLTVTDSNGCSGTLSVLVPGTGPSLSDVAVSSDFSGFGTPCASTSIPCQGDGAISGVLTGGTSPYTITIDDGSAQTTFSEFPITGLCAGSYTVSVEDANGETAVFPTTVIITSPPAIVIQEDEVDCANPGSSDGSITTLVSGGVGGYTYTWQPGGPNGPDNPNVSIGMYILQVSDDNNCTAEMLFNVQNCEGPKGPCYEGISVITPNNDFINDFLIINCAANNPNSIKIYDRYGRLVYEATNYNNNWGGLDLDNELLQEGAYFWVMEILFSTGESRIEKGTVTLLRND